MAPYLITSHDSTKKYLSKSYWCGFTPIPVLQEEFTLVLNLAAVIIIIVIGGYWIRMCKFLSIQADNVTLNIKRKPDMKSRCHSRMEFVLVRVFHVNIPLVLKIMLVTLWHVKHCTEL